MRLFVGLPVPENIKNKIITWQKNYSDLPIRRIRPENLHITLIPPWEAPSADEASGKLLMVSRQPLTLSFTRIRAHILSGVVLAEMESVPDALTELRNSVHELFGVKTESRPFLPHLTLARFVNRDPFDGIAFPEIRWNGVFDAVVLFRSHLTSRGAEYEEIAVNTLLS